MKDISPSDYLSCDAVKYDYLVRLNRAIDYIRKHYGQDLNLEKLAKIACFSKYHFHRLFRCLVGETINDFLRRFRLEKAIHRLIVDKKRLITDIALDCGFSSSQNFAKVFKAYYGVTATFVRQKGWGLQQNGQENSAARKSPPPINQSDEQINTFRSRYREILERRKAISVIISDMPSFHVAYLRRIGPYEDEKIAPFFTRLMKWSALGEFWDEKSLLIASVWNNPFITPGDRCICDACLTIPESVKSAEGVNIQTLPGGKYAVYHQDELEMREFPEAWMRLIDWLILSDYLADDRPSYMVIYQNRLPLGQPGMVDLCLAIKSFKKTNSMIRKGNSG